MKEIVNNKFNLKEKDIIEQKNKARALIIDKDLNVIIINYADVIMLPGGKIDRNETEKEGLIREVKEELGIDISKEKIIPLANYSNYMKDYPTRDNIKVNRLNKTKYFVVKTDQKVDLNKVKLTESEKNNKFEISKINLFEIEDYVTNYKSSNIRNKNFSEELLEVLKEYKKYNSKEKIIDMHTHTNYSDGELDPNDLIKLAIKRNIGIIAITDHDTIEGLKKINREDPIVIQSGIKVINGIELSAKVKHGRMHILGYGMDLNNKELKDKMEILKDRSINYILSLIVQLKKDYGIEFTYKDIKELVEANHNLGRPDLARLCVKYGHAKTIQEAFDKYLIDVFEKVRNEKSDKGFAPQECINIINNSGGIPVLAHPKTLELSEKEFLIQLKELINFGLKGIEVYHSTHTKEDMKYFLEIAKKYNLLVSGGSDYHGKIVKPDVELGTGIKNNLKIKKLSLLNKIIV